MGLGNDEDVTVDDGDGDTVDRGKSFGSVSCSICLEVVADNGLPSFHFETILDGLPESPMLMQHRIFLPSVSPQGKLACLTSETCFRNSTKPKMCLLLLV